MRVIVQRVNRAKLTVGDEVVSSIGKGLVCLCGLCDSDSEQDDLSWMASRILNLQLWPDSNGRPWKESVVSQKFDVLLVSQFTLYAEVNKGKKPDFHRAMNPTDAKDLYAKFVQLVQGIHGRDKVFDGRFGAMMEVELVNDGPVTITLESPSPSAKVLSVPPLPATPPSKEQIAQTEIKVGDPAVLLKRAEKKLAKVHALRQRVEKGEVVQLAEDQQLKLASELSLTAEVEALRIKVGQLKSGD